MATTLPWSDMAFALPSAAARMNAKAGPRGAPLALRPCLSAGPSSGPARPSGTAARPRSSSPSGLGAWRTTRSHEPLGLAGVASVMTSTVSSSAVSLPAPQVILSTSPSRVRKRVVAGAAVERVAGLVDLAVGAGLDVAAGQRPQGVVAVAAVGRVVADVGEDRVVAVAAVLDVVAGAAVHAVVAVLAVGGVVAGAAGDAVARVAAVAACRCPTPPKMRSKEVRSPVPLASPVTVSSPGPPLSQSLPCTPRMVSLPRPPKTRSLPGPPMSSSSPPKPWMRSLPPLPSMCRRRASRAGARRLGRPGWSRRTRCRRDEGERRGGADE